MRRALFALAFAFAVMLILRSSTARADEPRPADPDARTSEAREAFARANELAKREDWREALGAFLHSYELKAHPTTAYNIATCRRVLGEYTAARAIFEDVLKPGNVEQLPPALVGNARDYKQELDRIVAHVVVTIEPAESEIAIDGRPLQAAGATNEQGQPLLLAGVAPSGRGEAVPASTFELVVDPGTRVIVLSRKGYRDVVRTERFDPGARTSLRLDLERLPATLRITSNIERAIVTVNGVDVGMAPVDVPRAPGTYRVVVAKEGFVPHQMVVKVEAGEDPKVDASLVREKVPITKRWWFWAAASLVVAGGVAVTYAATRPEPQPPDYERGNTGWLVELGR